MDKHHYVFVYGSLIAGLWNHHVLHVGAPAKFIAPALTVDEFLLADGSFPRMARGFSGGSDRARRANKSLGKVRGQVWRVGNEAFAACDCLEGHPTFYRREQISITGSKGVVINWAEGRAIDVRPWAYIIQSPPDPADLINPTKGGILSWTPPQQRS